MIIIVAKIAKPTPGWRGGFGGFVTFGGLFFFDSSSVLAGSSVRTAFSAGAGSMVGISSGKFSGGVGVAGRCVATAGAGLSFATGLALDFGLCTSIKNRRWCSGFAGAAGAGSVGSGVSAGGATGLSSSVCPSISTA